MPHCDDHDYAYAGDECPFCKNQGGEQCPECGDKGFWSSGRYWKCENGGCDVNAYSDDGNVVSQIVTDDSAEGQCRGDDITLVSEGLDVTEEVGVLDVDIKASSDGLEPVVNGFSMPDEQKYEFTMEFDVEDDEDVKTIASLLGHPVIEVSNEYWDEKPFIPVDLVNVDGSPSEDTFVEMATDERLARLEREIEEGFERIERMIRRGMSDD